jgi:hypothetical protein
MPNVSAPARRRRPTHRLADETALLRLGLLRYARATPSALTRFAE